MKCVDSVLGPRNICGGEFMVVAGRGEGPEASLRTVFNPKETRMAKSRTLRLAFALATGLVTILVGVSAAAAPTYVGYPAPGGNSVSGSGAGAIYAGGKTWTYSAFDPNAYGDLYYGIGQVSGSTESIFNPGHPALTFNSNTTDSLYFNGGFSNLAAGYAVFSGISTVYTVYGPQAVSTLFTLKVTDTSGNAIALIDPATVGLSSALGGVLHVTGDYKANWQFVASLNPFNSPYVAARTLYDSLQTVTPSALNSSVAGAFYATAPVPEPEAYALALASLAVIGVFSRRRKNS